ncbi:MULTISPECIES: LysR family transcriptional regulator [Paraburkholderia]|uniref:LysR family transcriptional regulator n=1 Tax=Paraburkholderia TaxID=1822464 RepID=UPI000B3F8A39|nr:LysR family transcriptional regulator [Paraburkholderia caledonica]
MDRLQAMQTFVKVVEMNSFSRAADALQIPRPAATTIIKNLEVHLKVRLMQRTTRRLSLTPEGARYYELCVRVLADIHECEHALTKDGNGPQGQLRVNMPGSVGRFIVAPRIMEFKDRYPDIDLVIGFLDRPLSATQETFDCAIRAGGPFDSNFVRRPLSDIQMSTAASPDYLERHGIPATLSDLLNHRAVQYYSNVTGRVAALNFVVEQVPRQLELKGALALCDVEAYVVCGITGAGIIQAPTFLMQSHFNEGRLVEVLPQWKPLPISLSALYPSNRHLAAKVRVFVDWIASIFEDFPTMRATGARPEDWFGIATDAGVAPPL